MHDKEYYRRAYMHLQHHKMVFCYGEDGEFITIGKCKEVLELDNCMVCGKKEINGECIECNNLVAKL